MTTTYRVYYKKDTVSPPLPPYAVSVFFCEGAVWRQGYDAGYDVECDVYEITFPSEHVNFMERLFGNDQNVVQFSSLTKAQLRKR